MKRLKSATFAAVIALSAGTTMAQQTVVQTTGPVHVWEDPYGWWGNVFAHNPDAEKFTANELSFDMFGSYIAGQRHLSDLFDTSIRHGKWGGGVGLNYFFLREIGIGGDVNMHDNGAEFVDFTTANLIARIPLGNSGVAPYIFGGGAYSFDPVDEWLAQAGVGLELRFNPVTGVFADGRYFWADKSFDRLQLRAGLRLVF